MPTGILACMVILERYWNKRQMNTCTLTCDRNDRKPFMDFCKIQLERMGLPQIIIDYPPSSNAFDLTERFRLGVKYAKDQGFENIIVVESDDAYPKDYIKHFDFTQHDFIGWQNTTYYNIRKRTYQKTYHDLHSSLCATGFKISALEGFVWPPDDHLWLDIALWRYAKNKRWKLFTEDNPVLGIKHAVGRYGGKGHVQNLRNNDHDLSYLKSRVDSQAFEFYSNLTL